MDYTLNAEAAKAADVMNSRLDETGKYVGAFTRAEAVTSKKGATGIDLSFKADDGRTADYLSVWTHGKDGKEIYGFKQLMAIMTCLRIKQLSKADGVVEKYNRDEGKMSKFDAEIFPDLMNKKIGLLLQRESYIKQDGSEGNKLNIAGVFDAETEFTASEILNKQTTPELLTKMVGALKDKPGKQLATVATASDASGDDDFPF